MTRGITQEQSEQLRKNLSEDFGVPEDEVVNHVAKILAAEIRIDKGSAENHFSELNNIINSQVLNDDDKFNEIEEIQNAVIDLDHDTAVLVFSAIAKELIIARDNGVAALNTLKKGFEDLFNNDGRDEKETAKAILLILSDITKNITDKKLLDAIGEAFENSVGSDNFNSVGLDSFNDISDLESEASLEDILERRSQTSEKWEEQKDDEEIDGAKMPSGGRPDDKKPDASIKNSQDEKKIEEDLESEEAKKKQQDKIKEEEERKKKQQTAKESSDNSAEKPKEEKSLWQILKDGSKDISTNKIPRAIGAVILGDFAALSIGGALGGPVGLAVVFLFWQFTKDSKEKDKTADKEVYDVNAEAEKYKKEREEIRKEYRGEKTAAGKAASSLGEETANAMREQKNELESAKKTISGVGLDGKVEEELKKVASDLRNSGVEGAEGDKKDPKILSSKLPSQGGIEI